MEGIRSIVARFPHREFDIRRLCVRDPRFRSICADYEEAARALRYWQQDAHAGDRMVVEYASFLCELEEEVLEELNGSTSKIAPP
jgi:hypothetical protein